MIARTTSYTIDLDSATVETRWDAPLTYGDKSANIIHATLMRGSAAATLSGLTAILYGVLSNGTTAAKAGSVTGNVVTVELDSPFYAIPGKIDLLLQLAEGTTVINTPLRITAYVKTGQTDELVSAGEQFSLAELQAVVAACQSATSSATSAATSANGAATAANTAAGNAQDAADAITGITVGATAVAYGNPPTAVVTEDPGDGHLNVAFGLPTGATGIRGTVTYSGTAITGTSTTPTAYATGIAAAIAGDLYHYNGVDTYNSGNEYRCTVGGNAATARWVYNRNVGGIPVGSTEPTGEQLAWVDTSEEPPEAYDLTADMVAEDGGGSVQDALDAHTSQLAEKANQTTTYTKTEVDANVKEVQDQVDVLVVEGDSSVEAAQARVPAVGNAFVTLKARLDNADLTTNRNVKPPVCHHDFSTKSNGVISEIDSEQTFDIFDNASSSTGLTISGGYMVHGAPAGNNAAGYLDIDLPSKMKRIGASFVFPSADGGTVALCGFITSIVDSLRAEQGVPYAGIHVVSTPTLISAMVIDGAGVRTLITHTYPAPLSINVLYSMDVFVEQSTLYIIAPDGSALSVYDAAIDALTGNVATFELFESTTAYTPAAIKKIWADTADFGGNGGSLDGVSLAKAMDAIKGLTIASNAGNAIAVTDLNDALDTGFYQCAPSTTNAPNGFSYNFLVISSSDSYKAQFAFQMTDATQYYIRTFNNGTWTAWALYGNAGGDVLTVTDLNDGLALRTGFYQCYGASNAPDAGALYIQTISASSQWKMQYAWYWANINSRWYRSMVNGTWGSWTSM